MKIKVILFTIGVLFFNKTYSQIEEELVSFSKVANEKKELKTISLEVNHWKFPGNLKFDISNNALKDWNAGGNSSISSNFEFNKSAIYRESNFIFENTILFRYGVIWENIEDTLSRKFNKLDDKLEISSSISRVFSSPDRWFFNSNVSFKTQIDRGYPDRIKESLYTSTFLAPAYLNFNLLGIEYKQENLDKNEYLFFFLTPISNKSTFVLDKELSEQGSFGVSPGKNMKIEMGMFFENKFQYEVYKNVIVRNRIKLFANYIEKFGNIDMETETEINMIINKYLTFNIFLETIYDDDIKRTEEIDGIQETLGATIQIKQKAALTFVYSF